MNDLTYSGFEGKIPDPQLESIVLLQNEIFKAGTSVDDFRERLERKRSLLCLVASVAGTLLGYKIGYERNSDEYFSWLGGVREGYRKQGIATELMRRQQHRARELGYKRVLTESENRWREMIILNLKEGFSIVGTCIDPKGGLKIIMAKDLAPPPRP